MMNKVILVSIIFFAAFLRFYLLGSIPLSLNWDEVSNGYNAYSILKTGRDEYGNFLPLSNRSFDDYKPPIYMYLNVPSVAIFDLTPFAARFPSAFFGFITIVLTYYLARLLLIKKRVALLSAFFLAISSWHLQFSRVGFEANIGLFFSVAAFTAFLYTIKKVKPNFILIIISAIIFGFAAYSYHSQRIFIPLLFVASIFIYKDQILSLNRKYLASFLLVAFILVLPLLVFLPREAISKRFESTTQKAFTAQVDNSIKYIEQDKISGQYLANIIHNRRVFIGLNYLKNYLLHFGPNFLFTSGDNNPRHHVEKMGMLYLFQLPLLLVGMYIFVKQRTKGQIFLLSWLLLAPIPAIAGDAVPHAVRALNMVIPLTIISAFSLNHIIMNIKNNTKYILSLFVVIIIFSFFPYLHNYYVHYPKDHFSSWQYGYKEAVIESQKLGKNFNKVIVDSSLEQSYIFWLFYSKYDPAKFQKIENRNFDNFIFSTDEPIGSNDLFISAAKNFPHSLEVLKKIDGPDNTTQILIGRNDEQ